MILFRRARLAGLFVALGIASFFSTVPGHQSTFSGTLVKKCGFGNYCIT